MIVFEELSLLPLDQFFECVLRHSFTQEHEMFPIPGLAVLPCLDFLPSSFPRFFFDRVRDSLELGFRDVLAPALALLSGFERRLRLDR